MESEVISDYESQQCPTLNSIIVVPETASEPAVEQAPDAIPDPLPEPMPGTSKDDANALESIVPGLQLDNEVLEILGEDPTVPKVVGKDILPALGIRLEHIATTGLTSELRKELLSKYALPSNCPLLGAPSLNPEVKAAITESVLKRDQSIEGKQKQLAIAISCVTEAITPLMTHDKKDPHQLQLLMDAVRMLCDIQYKHTSIRRGLLMNNLKKDLKDQIQGTKVDSFLFGHNFADNLKTAKAISKSGAELKPTAPKAIPPKKGGMSGPPKKNFPSTSQHLNWKAPPPGRRSTGTQRMREPATPRSQRGRSSQKSSLQGPARSWR